MPHSYTFNGVIFHSRSKCVVYFTEEYPSTGCGEWIGLLIRRKKKKLRRGRTFSVIYLCHHKSNNSIEHLHTHTHTHTNISWLLSQKTRRTSKNLYIIATVARACPSAKLLSRCFMKIKLVRGGKPAMILGFLSCAVTLLPGSARLGPASPPLFSPAANLLCLIICFPIMSLSLLAEKLSALVMWTRSLGLQPGAMFDAWNIFIPIKRWREGELLSHRVDWVFSGGCLGLLCVMVCTVVEPHTKKHSYLPSVKCLPTHRAEKKLLTITKPELKLSKQGIAQEGYLCVCH